MADIKFSALPNAAALTGAEVIPAVQSGGNVKIPVSALRSGSAAQIDGLQPVHVSGTQISFASGTAYVPSLQRAIALATSLTKTPTLAASTWYYCYVYDATGTTDVEISTTVPAAPYHGYARTKTGDTSRRYIGAFKTNAAAAIIGFDNLPGGRLLYRIPMSSFADFQILNGGAATTPTDLDCSGFIPITARLGEFQLQINAGSLTNLFPSGVTASPTADLVVTKGSGIGIYMGACRIGNAQKVAYQAADASSTTYVWIKGYYEDR